jgi:hypothetical protein
MDLDYLDYNINRLSNEHLKLNNVTSKLQEELTQLPANVKIQYNLKKFKKRKLFVRDQLTIFKRKKNGQK